jgi:hypothetical protein
MPPDVGHERAVKRAHHHTGRESAGTAPYPSDIGTPETMRVSEKTDPTDRPRSPLTMTSGMPSAMMTSGPTACATFAMFPPDNAAGTINLTASSVTMRQPQSLSPSGSSTAAEGAGDDAYRQSRVE